VLFDVRVLAGRCNAEIDGSALGFHGQPSAQDPPISAALFPTGANDAGLLAYEAVIRMSGIKQIAYIYVKIINRKTA
jgi:hypothetical protein